MNDELGDRVLYLPRGKDPLEDLNLLSDAIAASRAALFDDGGGNVVGIDGGAVVGITPGIMRDVIVKHIALKTATNHGTDSAPAWKVTYPPYAPDEAVLLSLFRARTREDGALAPRLPKMPAEPHRLTPHQQREVQTRRKMGEPDARIAAAYNVTLEEVRRQAAR